MKISDDAWQDLWWLQFVSTEYVEDNVARHLAQLDMGNCAILRHIARDIILPEYLQLKEPAQISIRECLPRVQKLIDPVIATIVVGNVVALEGRPDQFRRLAAELASVLDEHESFRTD